MTRAQVEEVLRKLHARLRYAGDVEYLESHGLDPVVLEEMVADTVAAEFTGRGRLKRVGRSSQERALIRHALHSTLLGGIEMGLELALAGKTVVTSAPTRAEAERVYAAAAALHRPVHGGRCFDPPSRAGLWETTS